MGCVGRSCSSRQPWRLARRERDEQWLKLGVELPIQPPSIPLSSVLVPHGRLPRLSAAFSRTSEDARGSKCSAGVVYSAGRDAAGPVGASDAVSTPLRVCYLGGSVTEQKAGWRPRLTQWIRAQLAGGPPGQVDRSVYSLDKDESTTDGRVEEIRAWCGNSGSKVRDPELSVLRTSMLPQSPPLVGTFIDGIRFCCRKPPRFRIFCARHFVRVLRTCRCIQYGAKPT